MINTSKRPPYPILLSAMVALINSVGCGSVYKVAADGGTGAGGSGIGGSGAGGSGVGGSGVGGSGAGGSGVGGVSVGGSGVGGAGVGGAGVGGSGVGGASVGGNLAPIDGGTGGVGGAQGDVGPGCVARPPTLVGWWRGDGNARDALTGNDGTWIGVEQYGLGEVGQAFQFQGSQAVAVNSSSPLYPQGSFSVEAWFLTVSSAGQVIVSLYDCGGPSCVGGVSNSLYVLSISGGYVSFSVRDSADNLDDGAAVASGIAAQAGAWHHVVGVRDIARGELLLYQDGALAAEAILVTGDRGPLLASDDPYEKNPFMIGAVTDAGAAGYHSYFTGFVDEVGYYDATLGADDVARLFHAGAAGKCP